MKRVELACHTGYSKMDGLGFGPDFKSFVDENDVMTLVITDTGNIDSYPEMDRYIRQESKNTKLIMGIDIKVVDDRGYDRDNMPCGRLSLLIRNESGKKNLYRIISEGEINYKTEEEIVIPLSCILENREGLLIGSGSEDGILLNCDSQELAFDFWDYIEIPDDDFSDNILAMLLNTAEKYSIPAAVVTSPHYIYEGDSEKYSKLTGMNCNLYKHYKTTEELLKRFDFLGDEKAYELVVTNTNLIADMCDLVPLFPENDAFPYIDKFYPYINNQDALLAEICKKALGKKYNIVDDEIIKRLEWELNGIKKSKSAFIFLQIKYVIDKLRAQPYEIICQGNVGASLVAYLCGITEIDPIKTDLSPYRFWGYRGDKEAYNELVFSLNNQKNICDALESAPGVGKVLYAGECVKFNDECISHKERHPSGIFLIPSGRETSELCPIATIGSGNEQVQISGYECYGMDHILYKLDIFSHNGLELLKRLHEKTGIDPATISFDDKEVLEMFQYKEDNLPACRDIPYFDSDNVLNALKLVNCKNFDDLVRLYGLINGTDSWNENVEILISQGTIDISEALSSDNDIYAALKGYGIDDRIAFNIATSVRKGKISSGKLKEWDSYKAILKEHKVPDWFIFSCERIKYLLPKSHSYSYMMMIWRLAWYMHEFPLEYKELCKEE